MASRSFHERRPLEDLSKAIRMRRLTSDTLIAAPLRIARQEDYVKLSHGTLYVTRESRQEDRLVKETLPNAYENIEPPNTNVVVQTSCNSRVERKRIGLERVFAHIANARPCPFLLGRLPRSATITAEAKAQGRARWIFASRAHVLKKSKCIDALGSKTSLFNDLWDMMAGGPNIGASLATLNIKSCML